LLAERVLRVEAALYQLEFAHWPPDERLAAEFHRRICDDLLPDWAGRWRTIAVRVGNLAPPPPHQVALLLREYGDLIARGPAAAASVSDLTLELLAFAEGRFLSIHPFPDFNGRTIRLFLLELLRRLDLPRVTLAPESKTEREQYFQALEAADQFDWQPLIRIWQQRFVAANPDSSNQP
jgi:CRISPR-associated endonuclease/helicase Cas3